MEPCKHVYWFDDAGCLSRVCERCGYRPPITPSAPKEGA